MHRGLVHAIAWSLATGAAVTLSWWGVHTVMAGTAYDPPRALPLVSGDRAADPLSSSTHRPEPTSSSRPPKSGAPSTSKRPDPTKSPEHPRSPSPDHSAEPPKKPAHPSPSGSVKGYNTDGGRVVFDLGDTYATLVSSSPSAGWSMQVWKASTWIRVEFTSGADRVSVFCTWHDHAPRVDINTY